MGVLDRLLGVISGSASQTEAAGNDELTAVERQARELLETLHRQVVGNSHGWDYEFEREFTPILEAPREVQAQVVLVLLSARKRWGRDAQWQTQQPSFTLLNQLLRRKLPFAPEVLPRLVERFAKNRPYHASDALFLGLLETCLPDGTRNEQLVTALGRLSNSIGEGWGVGTQQDRKVRRRIDALIGKVSSDGLEAGESWVDQIQCDLATMPEETCVAWQALIDHAGSARSSRPSKKWLKKANEVAQAVQENAEPSQDQDALCERLVSWLGVVKKPSDPLEQIPGEFGYGLKPPISDRNAEYLRGLVWIASQIESPRVLAAIAGLAEVCFTKIPDFGAVNRKVGNACVWALGNAPSLDGVAWLARLSNSIRYPSVKTMIKKATDEAAQRSGMTARDLEEIALPTFDLDDDGVRRETFGEWTASLELLPDDKTSIRWQKPATENCKAKNQKAVPKAVREEFAAQLKELRADAKAIQKLLPGQRARFERFYLEERVWSFEDWRERYLEHPLAAHLARRLIWLFQPCEECGEQTLGCWLDGQVVGLDGKPLELSDGTTVRLWHPLFSEVPEILEWRRFLARNLITQPFKQAHREVYLLTDPELETEVYSNRFAGHMLKQHQVATLLTTRGWSYHLQGGWDSSNVPYRKLEGFDLIAEYWLEPISIEEITGAGIFLYVSSDQLCFKRSTSSRRLPLTEVPAMVFSEVMRDLDLFVSVSSIGADPTWSDDRRNDWSGYWHEFAFGELRASGETRRQILQELVPSLAASDRIRVDGKWLKVQGKLRNYRIHLGSGSTQMDPGGHLCIVPGDRKRGRAASGKLHLPFEGDALLSIIISKALMLVDDDKIEDVTIQRQIER